MDTSVIAQLVSEGDLWRAAGPLSSMSDEELATAARDVCRQARDEGDPVALVNRLVAAAPPRDLADAGKRLSGVEALHLLAVHVAIETAGEDWEELVSVIQMLAQNASYRVEEALVRLVARIATTSFASSKSFWLECLTEDTAKVAACALRGLAASQAPVSGVLELFSIVVADIRKDIRHALGPRAVPELARREPRAVYSKLRDWAGQPEEFARWNVAKALATPLGGVYVEDAMEILEYLAADERPSVWRAAAAAAVEVAQRRPAYVLPMLKRWRDDPHRLNCARFVFDSLVKRREIR